MPASNPAYSSPAYTKTAITGDRLATLDAASVRQLWKKGVEVNETQNDFWSQFEGNSPMSLIQVENDTAKGAGQKITFTNRSGLYGEPHMGEDRFTDSSHYEELLIGSNDLTVDWFRHGVEYTERAEEKMGMRGELMDGLPQALGEWGGRLKSEKIFMCLREQVNAENIVSVTDPLSWNFIVEHAALMKRWGAASALVPTNKNGYMARRYVIVAEEDALVSLEQDDDYIAALKSTSEVGAARTYFDGGWTDLRGHRIVPYNGLEHDGYGAIGSPMKPLGRLATAMTAVNVAAANYIVLGGSDYDANNILVKPAKYFPGYAYPVQAGVTLTPSSADFFVAIINPPNAATDPNKYGLYRIGTGQPVPLTANDGVKLAIEAGLTSAATAATGATSGAEKVTAANALATGSPAWDAAVHTNNHPVDALVCLVWPTAVPKVCSFMLGASAARRGYGKHRNRRTFDEKEGGFVRNVFFNTVMGQSVRKNRRGRAPAVLTVWHEGILAGTPLPTPS